MLPISTSLVSLCSVLTFTVYVHLSDFVCSFCTFELASLVCVCEKLGFHVHFVCVHFLKTPCTIKHLLPVTDHGCAGTTTTGWTCFPCKFPQQRKVFKSVILYNIVVVQMVHN